MEVSASKDAEIPLALRVCHGWRLEKLHFGCCSGVCCPAGVSTHTERPATSFLCPSWPACSGGGQGEIPPGSVSLSTEPLVLPAAKASLNSQAAKLASSKTFLFSLSMSSSVCNVREDSEQAGEDMPGTLPSLSLSVSIILGHGGCKAPPPSPSALLAVLEDCCEYTWSRVPLPSRLTAHEK